MDEILKGLNDAQTAAVTSDASVLQILAPPGSGKTKTLTTRVAYLISHHGYCPRNIIVCTFTVKAAREMKERIRNCLGDELAGQLILGTFHSISRRFLAKYGKQIGIDSRFGISDASDSLSSLTRIIKRLGCNLQPAQTRARISRYKARSVPASELVTSKKTDQQEFALVYAKYEEALKVANLLDYDDLLLRCADLLRTHPACVRQVDAVLIDEFQDTNNVQFDLMTLFAQTKNRITIVGDPDQSIYGFRSAEIKNLIKMREQYTDTHVINLEENYRSSGSILLAASEVIEQDKSRPAKRLKATRSIGMQPVLRKLPSATAEASWIVAEIQRAVGLTGRLLSWDDFAVLLRSASLSRLIESELGKAGIPYRMVGGHRFFDRAEVKLLLDYLRAIDHPDHNDAIARIVNVPSRKVGSLTIDNLLQEAEKNGLTLWALILGICRGTRKPCMAVSSQAQRGLESFTSIILTSQNKLAESVTKDDSLKDFVKFVVQKVGIKEYLRKTKQEDYEARWANVEELIAQASDSTMEAIEDEQMFPDVANPALVDESMPPLTTRHLLSSFLGNVALSTEISKEEEGGSKRVEQVTLSTIHASKGLEWPVVFVPAAYEGSIPHSRADDNDEERRLLYVAMTRAQSMLYVTCPKRDSRSEITTLSPFLSGNPLSSYFAKRGPSITCDDVLELASMLRRHCPAAEQIELYRSELGLREDNRWPSNEEEDEYDRSNRSYSSTGKKPQEAFPAYRRPRIDGNLTESKNMSMNLFPSAVHFDVSTTAEPSMSCTCNVLNKACFISANTAMIKLLEEEQKEKRTRGGVGLDRSATVPRQTTSKATNAQMSLTKFFVKTTPPETDQKHARKGEASDQASKRQRVLSDMTNVDPELGQSDSRRNERPTSTMHLTSIAEVRRRTLGVRRSFNGWQNRKNP